VSWTSIPGILGDMTGAAPEPKQCEWITRTPVFVKQIGNFQIDRSEWENESGAFFWDRVTPCLYAADPGHRYCPRHEMEAAMASNHGDVQDAAAGER
jgi:hypothetical protein